MSYTANQYNYATPLSSAAGLFGDANSVRDAKYFTLSNNVLDGSYQPITGDVGLWGTTVSDANGNLSTPFVVTVVESLTVNAFRLIGSAYNYPVAFTAELYNGNELVYAITETSNTDAMYVHYLPRTISVTSYTVRISKISTANSVAMLYNTYNPAYVKRVDNLKVKTASDASVDIFYAVYGVDTISLDTVETHRASVILQRADDLKVRDSASTFIINTIRDAKDTLALKQSESTKMWNYIDVTRDAARIAAYEPRSHIRNTIDVTSDNLKVSSGETSFLINVHSVMKSPSRKVYGKVYITYTDPMLSSETTVVSNGQAYNSQIGQLLDTVHEVEQRYFTLYDNNLGGAYSVSDALRQVGWVSDAVSLADGSFAEDPQITINFASRPIVGLPIIFDYSHDCIVEDFTVTFFKQDGSSIPFSFTGNTSKEVIITNETLPDIVSIVIDIHKVSKAGYPAVILEVPIVSTILYVGYQDRSNLISIDLLEELTYEDAIEALGGVSANEVTVTLDNSNKDFFFNSGSAVSKQLRRNRKIVPWLGTEITPGVIEWYTLGTFWSYKWEVPVNSLTAKVVGFDTIGLLGTSSFTNHQVLVDASIGDAIAYVLNDARSTLDFIEYYIDPVLYNIRIPYVWFAPTNHADALRKISGCYPMHIYCDRNGVIKAMPQKLHLDYYYDVWADNTNVIDKTYDSLYTTLPNVINVTVASPVLAEANLAQDNLTFDVSVVNQRVLNFNAPYVSDINLVVDCDATVEYTFVIYSWGIDISFRGTGEVRSISCTGKAVDISNTSTLSRKDAESIMLNGAVTRDVKSDFIQEAGLATQIINRLSSLSELDKYDATVNYRGDIALTINDPILLLNGIAPDNRYNIKRHQLFWNGSLTGSADLNT